MLSATPIAPSPDGSPPAAVVSAGLAALARERTARRAAEALAARLEAENAEIAEQVRRLEHLNDELRKLLFGKKSEKLGADERQLSFDDLGTAVSEAGGAPAADEQDGEAEPRRRQRRSARPGARFPAHIERRVDVIEPDSTLCPCGCGEMTKIGEDRSERLDIVPARFLVIETVRPRYACNRCKGGGVVQAAAPASLIEGGLPTEGVLAHVLISKYGDHLPLYRQSQIYARLGLDLHRATLADWVGKASFHLRPVVDCLAAELKTSGKLGVDETTIRVLDPGRGRTKTGYMWTMVRDERPWSGADPPGVVYCYAPGRGGKHGEKLLEGFSGTAQIDGYSGYNRLRRSDRPGGALRLASCWAHARRGLREIFDSSGSVIAKAGLDRIARLYAIEGEDPGRAGGDAPGDPLDGIGAARERLRAVAGRAALAGLAALAARREADLYRQPVDGLLVFLYDGRVEIDSNFVENRIRPLKLTAKNALFAGHDEGAAAWGRIASLIETCKMNRVEPYAWLKSTLEKIAAGHPQSKIHELLPWNFEPETD